MGQKYNMMSESFGHSNTAPLSPFFAMLLNGFCTYSINFDYM